MTADTQTTNDLAYEIAVAVNGDAIEKWSTDPNAIGQFSIEKAAEIIRAHIAPLQAQAAQDHEEADAYAAVMVECDELRERVEWLEARWRDLGKYRFTSMNEDKGPYGISYEGSADYEISYDPSYEPGEAFEDFEKFLRKKSETALKVSK